MSYWFVILSSKYVSMSIVNLRSEDASILYSQSHWINVFNPIVLNPQQSIVLKSAFIDTRADTSGEIIIESDLTAGLEFGYYYTYINDATNVLFDMPIWTNYFDVPDGRRYLMYENYTTTRRQIQITGVNFSWDGNTQDERGRVYGGFELLFDYQITKNGVTQQVNNYPVYIPLERVRRRKNATYGFNLIADINTVVNIRPAEQSFRDWSTNTITISNFIFTELPGSSGVLTPLTRTVNFTIPAGSYQPLALVNIVNRQLQGIQRNYNSVSAPTIGSNNLLTTLTGMSIPAATNLSVIDEDVIVGVNFKDTFRNSDLFFGTNQFNITYDDSIQKFILQQTHMPIYDNNSNIIKKVVYSNAYNDQAGTLVIPQNYWICGENSGVYIHNIINGDFWYNILGFEPTDLMATAFNKTISASDKGLNDTFNDYNLTFPSQIITTKNFIGIDDLVVKNDTYINSQSLTSVDIESNNLVSITASNKYSDNVDNDAYYLIECNLKGLDNNYIGDRDVFNKKIKGIVSKYYSIESYTTAGQESDITFTNNTNNQIFLDSCEIRILKGDLTEASTGEDNSIVLMVV